MTPRGLIDRHVAAVLAGGELPLEARHTEDLVAPVVPPLRVCRRAQALQQGGGVVWVAAINSGASKEPRHAAHARIRQLIHAGAESHCWSSRCSPAATAPLPHQQAWAWQPHGK